MVYFKKPSKINYNLCVWLNRLNRVVSVIKLLLLGLTLMLESIYPQSHPQSHTRLSADLRPLWMELSSFSSESLSVTRSVMLSLELLQDCTALLQHSLRPSQWCFCVSVQQMSKYRLLLKRVTDIFHNIFQVSKKKMFTQPEKPPPGKLLPRREHIPRPTLQYNEVGLTAGFIWKQFKWW